MRSAHSGASLAPSWIAVAMLCWPIAASAQFQNDDVLVGRRNGQIDIYRAGAVVRSLSIGEDNMGYSVRGLCFSTNRKHLYVSSVKKIEPTGVMTGRISRFDGGGALTNASFTSALEDNQVPGSCVVDIDGNVYVELAGAGGESSVVAKFDAQGLKVASYSPSTVGNAYGGVDLLNDQRTLVYAAGTSIRRYSVIAGQLDNLATVATGGRCYTVRARANGEVWTVCDVGSRNVVRFDARGRLIRDYFLFDLELSSPLRFSSDGASFWVSRMATYSQQWSISKIGIDSDATEEVAVGYLGDYQATRGAFAVYGEYTAATTECADGIDNDGNGKTDFPDDARCKSRSDPSEGKCFRLPFSQTVVCLGPWRLIKVPVHEMGTAHVSDPSRLTQDQ